MQIDVRVLELLSSKLCHDLISPVSAINNGVELIEDIGGSVVDEAMKIIGDSANLASRRLRLYRLAYGRAGSETNLNAKDVRQILESYFSGGKIVMTWPEALACEDLAEHRGGLKVLSNLMILGEEVLAYGGSLSLTRHEGENGKSVCLEVAGRAAQLSESFQAALEGKVSVEDLTPRTIQGYITGRFAEHFNAKISFVHPDSERLNFILILPHREYDENAPA